MHLSTSSASNQPVPANRFNQDVTKLHRLVRTTLWTPDHNIACSIKPPLPQQAIKLLPVQVRPAHPCMSSRQEVPFIKSVHTARPCDITPVTHIQVMRPPAAADALPCDALPQAPAEHASAQYTVWHITSMCRRAHKDSVRCTPTVLLSYIPKALHTTAR
jgi:hypothetical protein